MLLCLADAGSSPILTAAETINAGPATADTTPFRIGFSSATFADVNENDASAAVRVWASALAKERGIPADPQPKILRSTEEIEAALASKSIDAINLSLVEYAALRNRVALQDCVVAVKGKLVTEEYVLLAHRDSGITRLADLRGRKLGMLSSMRATLAPPWLETLLAKEGLGVPAALCSQIVESPKISKVVLPVFFKQLGACVVTRSGFETMTELNPQIGQQLKIVTNSPPVVPVIFCFRVGFNSVIHQKLLGEVSRWHTTPSGRQILNLFQSDSLEERPLSCLDSALEMLETHRRLCGGTNSSKTGTGNGAADNVGGRVK